MFGEFSARVTICPPRGGRHRGDPPPPAAADRAAFFNFGISYSFGSIFNNIINPAVRWLWSNFQF
jgi:hypothetical protein